MIEQIIKLRRKGLSFRKIAIELESTVGKVQYQWNKYMKRKTEEEAVPVVEQKQPTKQEQRPSFVPSHVWTSIHTLKRNNGMIARLLNEQAAFVFWKIPKGKWNVIASYYQIEKKNTKFAVRVNDITSIIYNGSNAHKVNVVPLQEGQDFLTVTNLTSNRSYCFEIGVMDGYETFIPILQSNPIHCPRLNKNQAGNLEEDMKKWINGEMIIPNWIEHVSTYSYYQIENQEDVKK